MSSQGKLGKIVPEYHSKNIFLRNLFFARLELALELARAKLESNRGLNVIDLGCGEGFLLQLLERRFKNIKTFGVDIEPSVIELKKILKAEIKIVDINSCGFPDNFFDIVFCLDVLEHFKNLDRPVREIKRILKSDGLLIVSLPTENLFYKFGRLLTKGTFSAEKGPCSSPHFHTAVEIEKYLSYNGFKVVGKKYLPVIPFLALFHIISFSLNKNSE